MTNIIEIDNLSKMADGRAVISQIDMTVKKGEIYGLVGPNGAGKTTLMKMLLNLVKPTTGTIKIFGAVVGEKETSYLRKIGNIIEVQSFYDDLTVAENLQIHADYLGYYHPGRIAEVLKIVGMSGNEKVVMKRCSLGMKQRVAIAKAILPQPELLILDEPVNGLDPQAMREMRSVFKTLAKEQGVTILISSHILSELEQIIDSIAIMKGGMLVEQLTLAEMHARSTEYYVLETPTVEQALLHLTTMQGIENCKMVSPTQLRIYDANISYQEILKSLLAENIEILSFEREKKTLEDYFINKTEVGEFNV